MITEIIEPVDKDCEKSLRDIQKVLGSDIFLAGLGKRSHEFPIPRGFNVLTDYERCMYLLNSQEMWHEPEQEGDKNFAEALDDAVDYLGTLTYDSAEARRRSEYFKGEFEPIREYIRAVIDKAYVENGVPEFLLKSFKNATPDTVHHFREYGLGGHIENIFGRLIRAAYFGGLRKWPVSKHLLECFSIGGFPVGWVGPLFKDGGKSKNCMQLLHFGPSAKKR